MRADSLLSPGAPGGDSWSQPTALLIGDAPHSLAAARAGVEGAGFRLLEPAATAAAAERLDQHKALGVVWAELEDGDGLDPLLDRLAREGEHHPVIVSAPRAMIDLLAARLDAPRVTILIDATAAERAAALALAGAAPAGGSVHDSGSDRQNDRLRQLSDEVQRIASTLARLSSGPEAAGLGGLVGEAIRPAEGEAPPLIAEEAVRAVIRARRARGRYFREDLFADPAWDMLLDLFQAEIAQIRVPVSSLCIAAAVPATTALRWIKTMTDSGLFLRRPDPHDGRRVFIELSSDAGLAMRRYFHEHGAVAGA